MNPNNVKAQVDPASLKADANTVIEVALRRERELREEGHEPFEWSFGQGPVYSCKLCAEADIAQEDTEWPCTAVRTELTQEINDQLLIA